MDVTCPRCQTDYEFDDALVSERGTTVKCTNCGHQFRVFRGRAGAQTASTTPEVWRIERLGTDVRLELKSLVELQRAIRAGKATRDDLLRRAEGPPRRLGDIPELEPFFPGGVSIPAGPHTMPLPTITARGVAGGARPPALPGAIGERVAPTSATRSYAPAAMYSAPQLPPPPRLPSGTKSSYSERPPPGSTIDAIDAIDALSPPLGPTPMPIAALGPMRTPPPIAVARAQVAPQATTGTSAIDASASLSALAALASSAGDAPQPKPSPLPTSPTVQPASPPRRRWPITIASLAVLCAIGAASAWPRLARWLAVSRAPADDSRPTDRARVEREIADGERARAAGDFSLSTEKFVRATTLDEASIAAWDGLCSAQSELAISHWLASLLAGGPLERDQAKETGASASKTCAHWAELAKGTDDGAKRASEDVRGFKASAAKGDATAVRVALATKPDDSLVQALAVMSEAAAKDGGKDATALASAAKTAWSALSRVDNGALTQPSDVALAAACASLAGQPARARDLAELLERRAPKAVILPLLRAPSPTASVSASTLAPGGGGAWTGAMSAQAGGAGASSVAGVEASAAPSASIALSGGDAKALNEAGTRALLSGDRAHAELAFKQALSAHPGDVTALYNLGQIARAKGDHASAIAYFKQTLAQSSGFLPARLALADEQWTNGDKGEAAKNYAAYLERVSDGSGADRARARTGATKPESPAP